MAGESAEGSLGVLADYVGQAAIIFGEKKLLSGAGRCGVLAGRTAAAEEGAKSRASGPGTSTAETPMRALRRYALHQIPRSVS